MFHVGNSTLPGPVQPIAGQALKKESCLDGIEAKDLGLRGGQAAGGQESSSKVSTFLQRLKGIASTHSAPLASLVIGAVLGGILGAALFGLPVLAIGGAALGLLTYVIAQLYK